MMKRALTVCLVVLCGAAFGAMNNNSRTEDGRFVIEPGAVTVDGHRLATTTELTTVRAELTNLVAVTSNRGEAIRMELTNSTAIAQATADAALPKSGGVMTGDLLLGGNRLYFGSTTNSPWAIGLGATNIMFGAGTNIFVLPWGVPPGIYVSNVSELTNALASATNSDVIWVNSGTYTFTAPMEDDHETYGDSCLLIPTNVTVRSISGVRSSVILDANSIGRVARLEDAASLLMGVTITNGVAGLFYGGGIYGGGASNCIISGNAGEYGGGSYSSALDNCTISGNSAANDGGGVYGGTATNSTISGNSANIDGGGASSMTLYNSIVSGNAAGESGGGISYSTIYDSTISSNCAIYGGGVYYSTIYRCIVFSNSASSYGGGVDDCSAYNCLILTNAADDGGGAVAGTLYNCVLSGNSATGDAGGSYMSSLYNCISWGNNKVDDSVAAYYSCGAGYTGTGSITNDPLFIGSGDYRLQAGSPCIDTGTNGAWTAGARDLDGNQRIWPNAGIVDMGAYEYDSESEYP